MMINKDAVKALWGDADEELFFEMTENNRIVVFKNEILNRIRTALNEKLRFNNGKSMIAEEKINEVIDYISSSVTFDFCIKDFDRESFNAGRVVEKFQRDVNEVLFEDTEGD